MKERRRPSGSRNYSNEKSVNRDVNRADAQRKTYIMRKKSYNQRQKAREGETDK